MPRQARVVAVDIPHRITQTGNNRQDVFLLEEDRRFYIEILREKCEQFGVSILGWCLMTNHVHLVAVPGAANSLASALGQAHWRHAMRFNRRYRRSGHLWQNRFYSCPLGRSQLLAALRYVDLNPVRAGLVARPADYAWSSAGAHLAGRDERGLMDAWSWQDWGLLSDWEELLAARSTPEQDDALRYATYNGVPLGDKGFVDRLEAKYGRRLRRSASGPQAKGRAEAANAAQ